ncbi:MAG: hypothetical protein HQ483_17765 [Rhodospirillales bacterium]|nr:hypothetical protein [Rhodospirillales bacterium]
MYADKTLTPKETVRFCALGTLAGGAVSYSQLAIDVRHFIDRVQGPSLDVLGTSIELLKYEGLVVSSADGGSDARLEITDKGHEELIGLLTAPIRATDSDHNKLIEALKFRYMHLLSQAEQQQQAELLAERTETELVRLLDLRDRYAQDTGHLVDWLDREIRELENRLLWLENFQKTIS